MYYVVNDLLFFSFFTDIIRKTKVQQTLDSLIFPKVMKKPSKLPWLL